MLRISILYVLFFFSGIASLLYQVMWMKELSLLFGSTTQSSAVTVAAFFLGLGLGAQFFGKRIKNHAGSGFLSRLSPALQYCFLELAIAVSALTYFVIFPIFNGLYVETFHLLIDRPMVLLLLKMLLSIVLLAIPAFFMGGTLPVMSELAMSRGKGPSQKQFGKSVAGIYFINTLGACAGAIAGGFWLPEALGFHATYYIAISISFSLALLVWLVGRFLSDSTVKPGEKTIEKANTKKPMKVDVPTDILVIAAWSGMASLALQILWTRLFSQVLQNSSYTFSAILSVFLMALTLGAFIAGRIAKYAYSRNVLAALLLLSGLLVALTPNIYMQLTDEMSYIGGQAEFWQYILSVMGTVALTIAPAVIVMGICLPYLYKLMENSVGEQFGAVVGRINSVNTYAGIAGSLLAGFVLFHWLGTWQAIYSIALLYMLCGVLFFARQTPGQRHNPVHYGLVVVVALTTILLNPGKLPVVPFDPIKKKERLLEYWEGSSGTVAVVDKDGNLKTKLNNWYALGGSKAKRTESLQTHLPVNLHGRPESVFYLGLGTGITAGTVLNYPVKKVVVAELVKEVITASEKYFAEFTNDLFNDDRVTVVNEDGRQYLQGTQETFDLIIADLFIPWRAGVSNLYALEHYQQSIKRLNEDGFYVQWVPLYQVSQAEFAVIAKTMKQVFPVVTAWRGDFYAAKPIMALVGHKSDGRLTDQQAFVQTSMKILENYEQSKQVPLLSHYVGQIQPDLPFMQGAAINTDDKPIIEYMAPVSHRLQKSGKLQWFIGTELLGVMHQMRNPQDTYLAGLNEQELRALFAGYFLHAAQIARKYKNKEAQEGAMREFEELIKSAD